MWLGHARALTRGRVHRHRRSAFALVEVDRVNANRVLAARPEVADHRLVAAVDHKLTSESGFVLFV